jgi:hypothetical protein
MTPDLTLPLVLALALVHVFAGALPLGDGATRRRWVSFSGGIAIAYVFVEILPGLSRAQGVLGPARAGHEPGAEVAESLAALAVYLLALAGLLVFHGLERLARHSRRMSVAAGGEDATGLGAFWLHVGAFAVYNALFGFLLNRMATPREVALLFAAVALHYVGNDHHLREHHKRAYDAVGRWVLGAAILIGWALALAGRVEAGTAADSAALAVLKAVLAGGVILNVLTGELPTAAERSFRSFVAGAAVYAGLLVLV